MNPAYRIRDWITDKTIELPERDLSIIDIGFQQPGDFFDLYHTIGISKYLGIEKILEKDCCVLYDNISVSFDLVKKIYTEYVSYCKKGGYKPLEENPFHDTFSFIWQTDIVDYIKLPIKTDFNKPNFGVLSKILHKIESKETASTILKWYADNSADNSYAYISVMGNQFERKDHTRDYTYSTEEFKSLINSWDCLLYEEDIDGFHAALIKKRR